MPEKDPLNIIGRVVAEKYRIEQLVGEGGFALVYLAEHTIWKQPVAVKFFTGLSQAPAESREELLQQFLQEGALLTELSSQTAGIVQARDVGAHTTAAGQWIPFMVLEWLDGSPLDAILAQDHRAGHPWTEGEVVGFLRRILPILDVAHRRGIAHRDIKPANIFIMGSAARAPSTPCKLLDFGVAKMVSDQAKVSAALAKTGVAITSFTPRYGAPEQFTRSYGATGPWTDVYSLALVACEMLAGRAALQGEDLVQFGFSSANPAQRPTPRSLGARISAPLEAVFAKALAVRPEDRFQHAGEFLESILAAAAPDGPLRGAPAPPAPAHAAPSSSLQLAPTVLVPTERPVASPATTKPEPPAPEKRGSNVAGFLLLLILLAVGLVVFSTTDLRGAREVRDFLASLRGVVREEAAKRLPDLQEKTRRAVDDAVGLLGGSGGQAGNAAECPPGTRPAPAGPSPAPDGLAGSDGHGASASICVDEALVSEMDYAACASCEQPKLGRPRGKLKPQRRRDFCSDGKAPTAAPIRCVTWKQAAAYCLVRAARLPTASELQAVRPMTAAAPMEWTSTLPRPGRERGSAFRCARSP